MKICTHDGRFHCDEVLACTMLTRYTEKYRNASITRSRDPKKWEQADIVVDVGGKYEPPKLLDHHQIQFQETYPGYDIRMSSAGLVYLHHPEIIPNVIQKILQSEKSKLTFTPILNQGLIKEIRQKVYKNFMAFVDANDNGIDKVNNQDVTTPTTLWHRVAKINPMWWDESDYENQLFCKAMDIVDEEFYGEVRQIYLGSVQTVEIVREAYQNRIKAHPSGKIVVLQKYVPWQKPITTIEEQTEAIGNTLYVIFPEKSFKKWRIQAVSLKQGSFELRKPLKEEWRGIKDQEKLKQLSGIKDIDFVHANGFIGGAVSMESAIKMGQLSME